jgi:hypothetical protein
METVDPSAERKTPLLALSRPMRQVRPPYPGSGVAAPPVSAGLWHTCRSVGQRSPSDHRAAHPSTGPRLARRASWLPRTIAGQAAVGPGHRRFAMPSSAGNGSVLKRYRIFIDLSLCVVSKPAELGRENFSIVSLPETQRLNVLPRFPDPAAGIQRAIPPEPRRSRRRTW